MSVIERMKMANDKYKFNKGEECTKSKMHEMKWENIQHNIGIIYLFIYYTN